jgi:hypothetical protein
MVTQMDWFGPVVFEMGIAVLTLLVRAVVVAEIIAHACPPLPATLVD